MPDVCVYACAIKLFLNHSGQRVAGTMFAILTAIFFFNTNRYIFINKVGSADVYHSVPWK